MATRRKTSDTEVNSHICQRCGFDNSQKIKVDPELLHDYYKKLLIQQPFEKEYHLCNEAVSVVCTEPTRKLLSSYIKSWDILGSESVQYATDLLCILLISKITHKTETGFVTTYETTPEDRLNFFKSFTAETIEDCFPESYQNIPQVLIIGIKRVAQEFNELCLRLSEEAQDKNFWEGVGHV